MCKDGGSTIKSDDTYGDGHREGVRSYWGKDTHRLETGTSTTVVRVGRTGTSTERSRDGDLFGEERRGRVEITPVRDENGRDK